ncbi:DNA repair protein HhH-GPD [Alicyclobacillus cellulosilyticus]|uniref:DNA repair protein HhH-GPD n=1 Tax=Alicyclobacillus cellulosilyticus TaxID=1003997 RepID=A0A917KEZ6_9BACL|nr:type II toxin-antitoxin system HicB family antitoxin [Alicyclobacillus cellulosilyticus]GGJ10858.1 DNA repair protein HhH-GPD [Alicyclobacillus cellulosilyticus]
MSQQKNLEYYMKLPYRIVLYPAQEGGFVVEIPELPGCLTQADTIQEAYEMIEDAKRAWIETALEEGMDIPEPQQNDDYSGRFVVRIPRSLHRALAEAAERENVSLNQYVVYQLARSMATAKFKS